MGVIVRSLRIPARSQRAPTTTLGVPLITVKQPENNTIFGKVAGVSAKYSYYLSFNNF